MDKEKLLAPRADTASGLPEDNVEVPGMGTVRVRGLSRDEVFSIQKIEDHATSERHILSLAMVDPQLTKSEAFQWQSISPAGEIEPVTDKIRELSGQSEGADKSGVPGDGDEPDSGVRVLPSDEAGDDSRTTPGTDF